jgi:hypothetical protein
MKKIIVLLTLILASSTWIPVLGQIKYSESVFILSPEVDTRSSISIKAGVSNIYTKECGKYCFKMYYHQMQAKYNFSKEAIGLHTAVGYSNWFIGGRAGVDYEYGLKSETHDVMVYLTGGLDIGGAASLQFGPKVNLTRNNSSKALLFMAVLDFPISLVFQKGKVKEALQGIKASKAQ